MQNGFVESFNGRMRDELLNESLFFDLDDARAKIAAWVADFNTARPHSALGYHAGGLRRQLRRNGRSAAQSRPARPIARCSHRATRHKTRRGSNRRWMTTQRQVNSAPSGQGSSHLQKEESEFNI